MFSSDGVSPLDGYRVVDLSRYFAGPYCAMMLGDLGADVIKIEAPQGDGARQFGPPFLSGEGMNFIALNRNKRGMTLDLKQDKAQDVVHRLVQGADVVVQNFQPRVAKKLGVDLDSLREVNPELVYCTISGFGSRGPYKDRPALDLILQGLTGVMEKQGDDQPELMVITVADTFAASLGVQGVLAALLTRQKQGGQHVEVSLLDALMAAQGYRIISDAEDIQIPAYDDTTPYRAYETSDGEWITVAIVNENLWSRLCQVIDRPGWIEDSRFNSNPRRSENQDELNEMLEEIFRQRPRDEWLERLSEAGVPCGRVNQVEDLFSDPHVIQTESIIEMEHSKHGRIKTLGLPIKFEKTPGQIRCSAPPLGEHNVEVLEELGYSAEEIEQFHELGIL